jgi:hypothetical protein
MGVCALLRTLVAKKRLTAHPSNRARLTMPEPDFDPAPRNPYPYVDSARWSHLLSRYQRPQGIVPSVWWAWTTQTSVPHMPRLAHILKVIGIPEQVAIEALGWHNVPYEPTPLERSHQSAGVETTARPQTIVSICRWCLKQRRTTSRKAAEAKKRQDHGLLSQQERIRRTAERNEAKAQAQSAYRNRRAAIAERARLGYPVPRLSNGRIDYSKLPPAFTSLNGWNSGSSSDWRYRINHPEDDVEIT